MKTVDFYRVEVRYTGSFNDYSADDFFNMAQARIDQGIDPFLYSDILNDEAAEDIVNRDHIDNTYPCNKIATVRWARIHEEGKEE